MRGMLVVLVLVIGGWAALCQDATKKGKSGEKDEAIPPLPMLGKPVADRVPMEDATRDVSTAAVLGGSLLRRETAVPYVRMSVPEPFGERGVASAVEEVTVPQTGVPRPGTRQLK